MTEENHVLPQDPLTSENEALNPKEVPHDENPDQQDAEKVNMEDINRASRAAKVARQMAKIKEMKSAYSSSTTIDITTLTEDSDISSQNPLTEEIPVHYSEEE